MTNYKSFIPAIKQKTLNPYLIASGGAFVLPIETSAVDYVVNTAKPMAMCSLDIAEVTGKRHDHLMTDIRKMLNELGLDAPDFSGTYKTDQGNTYACFNLPRREVDILLTGYNTPLRAKVIDRWRELEIEKAMGGFAIPSTLSGALKLAAKLEGERVELTCRVEELEQKASENAVKVDFYDDMTGTEDLFNPCTASKIFDTGRTRYLRYLCDHKILMSRPHRINMPYQKYLEAGLFEVKLGDYKNRKTGKIEAKAHPMLTGKGVIWLSQFIEKNGRDGL